MGIYFDIGICTEIVLDFEREPTQQSLVDWEHKLNQELDLSLYYLEEEGEIVKWKLKPEFLEEGLLEFLEWQYSLDPRPARSTSPLFDAIRKASTAPEIIALAENQSYSRFSIAWWGGNSIFFPRPRPEWRVISFFSGGKIQCETGFDFFAYLQRLVQAQKYLHPLAGAVKADAYD